MRFFLNCTVLLTTKCIIHIKMLIGLSPDFGRDSEWEEANPIAKGTNIFLPAVAPPKAVRRRVPATMGGISLTKTRKEQGILSSLF